MRCGPQVTFVDEGRRFVTTSDDKTIRVWEYGIPVVIKYIADPSMHSVPAVAVSPNNNWMIGQSLDNQIVTYSTKERFRQNRKKVFKGHNVAGYACQARGVSPGISQAVDLCEHGHMSAATRFLIVAGDWTCVNYLCRWASLLTPSMS